MVKRYTNSHLVKLMASTAAILLLVIVTVCGLLIWSANEVDRISQARDRGIVALVLQQSVERVAHSQESSTVWDDAVKKLRERPLDLNWVDLSLGTWFSEYAGHDEVYILNGSGVPIYAMRNGHRGVVGEFDAIRSVADPLVKKLWETKALPSRGINGVAMLSPGAADLAIIRNRPAILSAKPVVSDSGTIKQQPGTEAVHLSVVYLDNKFVGQLSHRYGLAGARFAKSLSLTENEAAVPLRRQNGDVIGYFIWQPFAPGQEVMTYVAPVLLFAFLLGGLALITLSYRLYRRTVDLEASKVQAQHIAMHDALTGLPNRTTFESRIEKALAKSERDGIHFAVLYLDLDHFKRINDTLGHPAGDALIQEVAQRLTLNVREYDTVARLGGDEFAIILIRPEGPSTVTAICERILADLAKPFDLMGSQSFVGASIGIALAPTDGVDRTELTRKADIALYKAKFDGRGRYVFFNGEMDEAVRFRETTHRELRKAIVDPENQLKILYQPIFSTTTRRITGVEALLRWNHPERGLITPHAFINLAEQTGLIEDLGDWVLKTAVLDAASWPGLRLSVNVSSLQIRSRTFADKVLAIIEDASLAPERLQLEITESVLMDSTSDIMETLQCLRSAGVSIALDDFGTGYSSLSYIRDFAVDSIKIDRSFITAIDSGGGAPIVEAIISLAHASSLHLTAEGVETEQQLEFLELAGCDDVQGFLLSHPLFADAVTELIGSERDQDYGRDGMKKVA